MNAFGNLLLKALNLIPPVSVTYKKFLGNTRSADGILSAAYDEGAEYPNASVQPVPTEVYHERGMDMQKKYFDVYIPAEIRALEGQEAPDVVVFGLKTYKVWKTEPWQFYDGWTKCTVVEDKPDV